MGKRQPLATDSHLPETDQNPPEGWVRATLDRLLSLMESGSRPKGGVREIRQGIPSIGGEHLNDQGGFRFDRVKFVPDSYYQAMRRGHVTAGDILVVKDGATTGKVSLVCPDFPYKRAVVNEHVFICRPAPGIRADFLFRFLFSERGQREILANFQGSAQGGINQTFAPGTSIPVAPTAEQERIVQKVEALLARINAARERLATVPAILKRFRQSVLSAACSGRLTDDWRDEHPSLQSAQTQGYQDLSDFEDLSQLPETWNWITVRQMASSLPGSIQSGPFGSHLHHSEFQSTGVLAIGIDNVLEGQFSFGKQHRISPAKYQALKKFTARPDDVLITVMATIGRCCVVPKNIETSIITKHVYRITVNHDLSEPRFLMHALRGCGAVREQIGSQTRGQTRPGINGEILKNIAVPMPPLAEQHEIVRRIEALFKLAEAIEKRVVMAAARAEKLTQSILAKAFRGELVPTEAELARREGREYETAAELLARILAGGAQHGAIKRERRGRASAVVLS
jgi:type I restriction enzyme, S subunit